MDCGGLKTCEKILPSIARNGRAHRHMKKNHRRVCICHKHNAISPCVETAETEYLTNSKDKRNDHSKAENKINEDFDYAKENDIKELCVDDCSLRDLPMDAPKTATRTLTNAQPLDANRSTEVEDRGNMNNIMKPKWKSLESRKYQLKVNRFRTCLSENGDGNTTAHLPDVGGDECLEKLQKRSASVSSLSTDVGWFYKLTPLSRDGSPDSLESVAKDPSVDTPEPEPVNLYDSDEYNTDLEMDEHFNKDPIPRSDLNIGRIVYTQECERLGTPPQRQVLRGLLGRVLNLRNRSLGANAVIPICTALRDNLRVERLNLDAVDITDEGIQHLAEMLLDNVTITHLNLANNNLGVRGAQVLGHVLVVTSNLTNLNLSGNKLDENSSWYITSGIGSNQSITHLDLSYNDFGEQAGVLLGAALAQNEKLTNLNLAWNKVCGKGAVSIFRALMVNPTITVLNISWNGIGYEGTVALSKCLKRNEVLRDLDVSNNRLDWRCAFLLAEGLRANTTLTALKIGFNPLTTTGVMDILEATAVEESAITLLDCSEVPVIGAVDLLSATISRRRTFQFFHGRIVPTHDKIGQRIGREINPMLRIIEYLRMLGLRPLELLKTFDKTTSFELPRTEFIEQIKKIGVKLHAYEIEALANSISGKGYNKNVINYRKLSLAVGEVVQAERERKMKEREEYLQIKSYHDNILKKGTLDEFILSNSASARDSLDPLKMKSFQTIGRRSVTSKNSTASKPGSAAASSKFKLSLFSPLIVSNSSFAPMRGLDRKKRKTKVKN